MFLESGLQSMLRATAYRRRRISEPVVTFEATLTPQRRQSAGMKQSVARHVSAGSDLGL
jgi:hypothetical protein